MERIRDFYPGLDGFIQARMTPEAFALLLSSVVLTAIFLSATILMVYMMIKEGNMKRLGSAIAATVGLLYWSAQLFARLFFGYVGPSVTFSQIGIFKDAVFASGILWMGIALFKATQRAKK